MMVWKKMMMGCFSGKRKGRGDKAGKGNNDEVAKWRNI